jgi:filamentous hemagglutinin family protein
MVTIDECDLSEWVFWSIVNNWVSKFVSDCKVFVQVVVLITSVATVSAVLADTSTPTVIAMPFGGVVTAGNVAIEQHGSKLILFQTSERAIVNWQRFDVGRGGTVEFKHLNNSGSTLNRITMGKDSLINGTLRSNGLVLIENPQGVAFGSEADLKVSALVATTLRVADGDFLFGSNWPNDAGPVRGKSYRAPRMASGEKHDLTGINTFIALMAPEVIKEGVMVAKLRGTTMIGRARGETLTLTFDGNLSTGVTVDASVVNDLISKKRLIYIQDDYVIIAAQSVSDLKASVISPSRLLLEAAVNKLD